MKEAARTGNIRFKRYGFLAGCAAPAAFVRVSRAAEFDYKLAHETAISLPPHVRRVEMANAIYNETNGRLRITVFPNSTLGSSPSMLAQLRIGSIQFLSLAQSNYSSVVPVTQITSLGYAFATQTQPFDALDGELGAYIRGEFKAKGIYAFEKTTLAGFRHVTTSTKPIRTADDLTGMKIRTLAAPIFVDLFRALGASPVPIDPNEVYVALQTRVVDGQENGLIGTEGFRLYEVQKYLSLTNHIWGGEWLTANQGVWDALPPDVRAVVERNAAKYNLLERHDMLVLFSALTDKLRRQGMIVNPVDVSSMRAHLGPYYAKWKNEFGPTPWGLLEKAVGRLG